MVAVWSRAYSHGKTGQTRTEPKLKPVPACDLATSGGVCIQSYVKRRYIIYLHGFKILWGALTSLALLHVRVRSTGAVLPRCPVARISAPRGIATVCVCVSFSPSLASSSSSSSIGLVSLPRTRTRSSLSFSFSFSFFLSLSPSSDSPGSPDSPDSRSLCTRARVSGCLKNRVRPNPPQLSYLPVLLPRYDRAGGQPSDGQPGYYGKLSGARVRHACSTSLPSILYGLSQCFVSNCLAPFFIRPVLLFNLLRVNCNLPLLYL